MNRHAPLHKQNLNKLQRNALKQSHASQTTTTLSTFVITNAPTVTITRICSRSFFLLSAILRARFRISLSEVLLVALLDAETRTL